jgi:hypothetical protein
LWASEDEPRTTLHLIPGDAHRQVEDAERWTNEGGSFASGVTAPLPAAAARDDAMQFEIHQINGGQCHWCLVGEQGAKLAVSARAFGSAWDA